MKEQLTWKDYSATVGLLLFLFVLIPVGLWRLSVHGEKNRKNDTNKLVPGVMREADYLISRAEGLMVEEVTSYNGHDIYGSPNTREAIRAACENILNSISLQNPKLVGNKEYCDFYVQRGGSWIRADYNTIIGTQYPYDLQDFDDLLSSGDKWRLYPNGRDWRVKYKLRSEPVVILDFEVGSRDADYGGY